MNAQWWEIGKIMWENKDTENVNESAGDNLAHNLQITRRVHLAGVYNLSVTYVLDGPWPMGHGPWLGLEKCLAWNIHLQQVQHNNNAHLIVTIVDHQLECNYCTKIHNFQSEYVWMLQYGRHISCKVDHYRHRHSVHYCCSRENEQSNLWFYNKSINE